VLNEYFDFGTQIYLNKIGSVRNWCCRKSACALGHYPMP